jgi:hypothetical protein
MANPTTNYGFVLPTSTDLVTDLPADFDIALQGVDTRLKALQPGTTLGDIAYSSATANTSTRLPIGTTGQVLAVSGGVPAWTTTADVTPLTTKGDLFTFSTVDARLGVGTNGQTLVADSSVSVGMKWATPSSSSTFVGCRIQNSGNQSIANNTDTALTFDTETFDTNGFHSTSSNTSRITIPAGKAGYYQFDANVTWAAGSGIRDFNIYKNGARAMYFTQNAQSSNSMTQTITDVLYGAEGDYFELYVFQNNGSAINVQNSSSQAWTKFACAYLGA